MTEQNILNEIAKDFKKRGSHAFFLDIDGTMIQPLSDNGVSKRLANAIDRGHKRGHYFFVNTGRAYGYVPKSLLDSADFDGVVSGMGGHATFRGRVVHSAFLDMETVEKCCRFCEANGESIIFECEAHDAHGGRFTLGDSGFFDVNRDFEKADDLIRAIKGQNVIKITTPYVPDEKYSAFLDGIFDMSYIRPIYAEGALIGNDKGTGIFRVCEKIGVPFENTVAIGDSANDEKMLLCARISGAMGNAPDEIKAKTTVVCDRVENDGAAKLIEALIG